MPLLMRNINGMGLVLILLAILGLSLAAGTMMIEANLNFDEVALSKTRDKLLVLGRVISSTNLPPNTKSVRHYEQDVSALPTALSDLLTKPGPVSACSANTTTAVLEGWCGPYWTDNYSGELTFADGWGRTIVYDSGNRKLRSLGPDGIDQSGGGDDLEQSF